MPGDMNTIYKREHYTNYRRMTGGEVFLEHACRRLYRCVGTKGPCRCLSRGLFVFAWAISFLCLTSIAFGHSFGIVYRVERGRRWMPKRRPRRSSRRCVFRLFAVRQREISDEGVRRISGSSADPERRPGFCAGSHGFREVPIQTVVEEAETVPFMVQKN